MKMILREVGTLISSLKFSFFGQFKTSRSMFPQA
jgi:hypothetical protein